MCVCLLTPPRTLWSGACVDRKFLTAVPIALDLLWYDEAHANFLAWHGPSPGHFARQRPARLPTQRLSMRVPPVQTEQP